MKKISVIFILCVFLAGFAATAQAEPIELNLSRVYGVQGNVSFGGTPYSVRIGQWNSHEGVTGFALRPGYGLDMKYSAHDISDYGLSSTQLQDIKSVMAAHSYLSSAEAIRQTLEGDPDSHMMMQGAIAQLLIWEIVYDGGLTDFNGLKNDKFAADISSHWIWGSVGTNYESSVDEYFYLINSGLADPNSIELLGYYAPGENKNNVTLLAYGPAAPSNVPVPAAAWLMGTGLASLLVLRRRKL